MALIPRGALRARVLPRFPANLVAGNGIAIIKSGQVYTILVAPGFLVDGDKGDIVVSGGGLVWEIQEQAVTPAKHQHVAQGTFLARGSPGVGAMENLSSIDSTAQLQTFSPGLKGMVPASGGGTANFIRADGTWASGPVPVTVASLPSAVTVGAGARAHVSDSSVTTFTSVVGGGGANSVPVYSDGAVWRVG